MRHIVMRLFPVVFFMCASSGMLDACNGSEDEAEEEGMPTGSTCPPNSTLTYENFAKPFMESYCTRCHSSQLIGDARNGAPLGHDFDTEDGIVLVGEHVDENAAAGPGSVNEIMPPDGDKPSLEERKKLGEWLACTLGPHDAGADAAQH